MFYFVRVLEVCFFVLLGFFFLCKSECISLKHSFSKNINATLSSYIACARFPCLPLLEF